MPGGLLDMMGIDPVANRNRREQIMLQELRNKGGIDVQRLQNEGQLANTRAGGEEQRKTQTSRADIEKALELLRSNNLMTEQEQAQKLRIMEREGVVSNRENDKTFDRALTDTRIRKALQADTQTVTARQAPGFQESLNAGLQAVNLAPAFSNMATGRTTVNPSEMVIMPPSGIQLPPGDLNAWPQAQGAGTRETLETPMLMYPGMTEPIPGQPKVTRETTPGRIRVNPALLQQAQQQPTMTTPDPVAEMIRRMRASTNGVGMPVGIQY